MPESTTFDVAYAALLEITPVSTIGDPAGEVVESDGVVSVLFDCALPGYPGWKWTVSVATVEGSAPSALEVELMPSEGALLTPQRIPWADRTADYRAARVAWARLPRTTLTMTTQMMTMGTPRTRSPTMMTS